MTQIRESVVFVDVFAAIVTETERLYRLYSGDATKTIRFMHGHPKEVSRILIDLAKDTTGIKRYPFICLLQDFTETKGKDYVELNDLHVLIANVTSDKYDAAQRYIKNFKPYLYPIYDLFLHALGSDVNIAKSDGSRIEHDKTDRLYWGKAGVYGNDAEIFTDKIDAIEITGLKLKVKNTKCLTKF